MNLPICRMRGYGTNWLSTTAVQGEMKCQSDSAVPVTDFANTRILPGEYKDTRDFVEVSSDLNTL